MKFQETDLFGNSTDPQTRRIVLKRIEARFKTEIIREEAPDWVSKRFTIKECGDLLGIRVLDHIIIGDSYLSFVERGVNSNCKCTTERL